jgi:sugar lactone lactonase YvrE
MKRLLITLACAAALLALLVAPPLAGATGGLQPQPITTFTPADYGSQYGAFARGMAVDSAGDLIVGLTVWGATPADSNYGEIWRVSPDGTSVTELAHLNLTPYGAFMSIALDGSDRVYVAVDDFATASGAPGQGPGADVLRLNADGSFSPVAQLPDGSWPNGIAFHKGLLYISDAAQGGIWRVTVGDAVARPSSQWLQSGLLPAGRKIGVTGIAFKGDTLYAADWDAGRIVRVPVKRDGTAGTPTVFCHSADLKTADGIAFDRRGRLWVAVNGSARTPSGGLYRVSATGAITELARDPGWLNYPTQPAFGRTASTATTLFLLNGAYYGFMDGSSPSILALQVGVPGLPLR